MKNIILLTFIQCMLSFVKAQTIIIQNATGQSKISGLNELNKAFFG